VKPKMAGSKIRVSRCSSGGQNGERHLLGIAFSSRQANPAPTASVSRLPLILIYNKTTSSASSPGHDEAWGTEDGAKSMGKMDRPSEKSHCRAKRSRFPLSG